MESMERTIKIGLASLASLLLVMMLALSGIAISNAATQGGISTLLGATHVSTPKVAASDAAIIKNPVQTTDTTQQAAPAQQQSGVVDARTAVRAAGPAVVTVLNTMQQTTTGRNGRTFPGGQGISPEASGSGVIIDNQGHIVTNQHVVANQKSLEVVFADGTRAPATLVGEDAYSDLAVIKVNVKVPAVAQIGDSDKLEPGQPVVAIGTALGDFQNTVTEGIVSALHRQLTDGGTSSQNLIQTDAAINHGNSGGPLLDLNGNVVGINTAVVRSSGMTGDVAEGLGFAIPSNTMKTVTSQLLKTGSISRPYIGITYEVITPAIATANNLSKQQGIYVSDVAAGSPAEKAGIKPDSIITRLDGVELNTNNGTTNSLVDLLAKHKVGDTVKLTVIAPMTTTEKEVTIVLAARPSGQ